MSTARTTKSFSSSTLSDAGVDDEYGDDADRSGYLFKHFNPTDEHSQLRDMVKTFVEREVSAKYVYY